MPELTSLSSEKRDEAMECFRLIQPFLEQGVALTLLSKQHDIPLRTLRRWVHDYRSEGLPGLTRKIRKDNGQRHLPLVLKYLIEGLALQKAAPSAAAIQRRIEPVCRSQGWDIPSHSTVLRVVGDLDKGLLVLAQEGTKAYQDAFDLLYNRDATAPNEIWQADHCHLKIFLLNEKGEPQKPLLTAILDDYSRAISGYNLTFRAPSAINTSLALRRAIWRKTDPRWRICGSPESFYTDHGSDFTSQHMEQVAAHLHMELIFSLVGMPRGRGRMERFFRTVRQLLLVDLPGYAPKKQAVTPPKLTLDAFKEIFHNWLLDTYHTRKHGGTGHPPQAMWEASGFLPNIPTALTELDPLLTFVTTRIVQQEGIRFSKYWYQDLTLSAYIGEPVTVRYDPDDIAELRVYYRDQFLCKAVCFELAGTTISLKEIIRARNRRKRELRQIIQERQTLVDTYLKTRQGQPDTVPSPEPSTPSPPELPDIPKLKRYRNE